MKLAVFNDHVTQAVKQSGKTRSEVLALLKENGVTALEYGIQEIDDIALLKSELNHVGMEICSIYQHCHYEQPVPVDLNIIEVANELNVKRILIVPGFLQTTILEEDVMQRCATALNELTKVAAKTNCQVTIENFDSSDSVTLFASQMRWFGEQVPDLRFTFDTGNFLYCGEEATDVFDELAEKISHVHAKDRGLVKEGTATVLLDGRTVYSVAVGQGVINMEQILRKLKKRNYQGFVTIEHFGAENSLQTMIDSAKWLSSRI